MKRKLSQFACHRLKQYSYKKPPTSKLSYSLPISVPYLIELGSPAHIGPHSGAIDYLVPVNTPILAAYDGIVVELIDRYSIPFFLRLQGSYWPTRLFRGQLNYLTLKHQYQNITEYTFYAHLKKNSTKVKLNQSVKAGQPLALTGWSGWMDKPHLHFVVYVKYAEKAPQYPLETHQSLTPVWNQS